MAITITQTKTMTGADGSSTTVSLAFDSAPAAGALIVAGVFWSHTAVESPSTVATSQDSLSKATGAEGFSASINQNLEIWYAHNVGGGTNSQTVTATFSAARTFRKLIIYELAGAHTSAALDDTSAAAFGPSVPDPGTITPTEDNTIIIALSGNDGAAGFTPATGFVEDEDDAGYLFGAEHDIQTTATERTSFWTAPTAQNGMAVAANFKVAPSQTDLSASGTTGHATGTSETAAVQPTGTTGHTASIVETGKYSEVPTIGWDESVTLVTTSASDRTASDTIGFADATAETYDISVTDTIGSTQHVVRTGPSDFALTDTIGHTASPNPLAITTGTDTIGHGEATNRLNPDIALTDTIGWDESDTITLKGADGLTIPQTTTTSETAAVQPTETYGWSETAVRQQIDVNRSISDTIGSDEAIIETVDFTETDTTGWDESVTLIQGITNSATGTDTIGETDIPTETASYGETGTIGWDEQVTVNKTGNQDASRTDRIHWAETGEALVLDAETDTVGWDAATSETATFSATDTTGWGEALTLTQTNDVDYSPSDTIGWAATGAALALATDTATIGWSESVEVTQGFSGIVTMTSIQITPRLDGTATITGA